MKRIKFNDLLRTVKGNTTVQVHCSTVSGCPAIVNKDGMKLSDKSYPTKDYKYSVLIDWDLPFSAPLARLGNTKQLLLVDDGTPVQYQKMNGNDEWISYGGITYCNTKLVVVDTPANRQSIANRLKREEAKALYLKDNISSVLTYGFELETQETEGSTKDEKTFSSDNIKKRLSDRVNRVGLANTVKDLEGSGDSTIKALKFWAKSELLAAKLPELDDTIKDHVISTILSEKLAPLSMCFDLPSNMEVVTDYSVNGFEFRTIGGLASEKYNEAADNIYKLDHKIDGKCSLHIHVGSTDIELPKSRVKQQQMINYIISDDRVPASVRDRWTGSSEFFRIKSDGNDEKRSFIRVHPQGTLEFRGFGNVTCAADAIECKNIASDAIAYAMAQDNTAMVDSWAEQVLTAMKNKEGKHLRNFKEYQERLKDLEAEFEMKRKQLSEGV